jgi:hypothetical protein
LTNIDFFYRWFFLKTNGQGAIVLPTKCRTADTLSAIVVILATIASAGGIFLNGLYRDNSFVISAWKGNDLVTLFIMVPILTVALILSRRGSQRAYLVWMGALDYMLYNYAFYLFAAAFNWFFLIYAALLGLSIFALLFGLVKINPGAIAQCFRAKTLWRWIVSTYMLFSSIGLSVVYLAQSIGFIVTNQLPTVVTRTGHPTSIIFALDLTLLILGAIWLLQRQPWGYILAGISTVKGPAYTLVLTVGSLWAANSGFPDVSTQIPIWVFLTVFGLIANALLFANMDTLK